MKLAIALLLSLAAAAPVAPPEETYETSGSYRPSDVVSKELVSGPHHQVQTPVVFDGYMYRFTVRSDYGPFEVTGTSALRKLVVEIGAIAKLREIKATKAFAAAVADSATGPFRFAKNLIVHPADTVTGIPKGAYKLVEEVGEAVTTTRNPADDPLYQKALLVSGRRRDYAAQLGVDVYSSNAVLQKELNSVAWAAAVGNLSVSVALMPVGGTAGAVVTGTRWSNTLNDYLKVEPANRLRILAEDTLKEIGIAKDLVRRFIDQPRFTPRQDVMIALALAELGPAPARGRDAFLEAILGAEDEVEATFFVNTAQMLRGYHDAVAPITAIRMNRRLAVASARSGSALVALPVDYLVWTETMARRSDDLLAAYRATGSAKLEVWLTGTASPTERKRLGARGILLAEQVGRRIEIVD